MKEKLPHHLNHTSNLIPQIFWQQRNFLPLALGFTIVIFSLSFLLGQKVITIPQVLSFSMSNDNFKIDFGNLNMGAGKPSGGGKSVSFTTGQIAPGLYSGTNFKVRAGFQYVYSIIPFRFTISSSNIDFGSVEPTNPVTRTNSLTISNGSANGYTVTAFENHQLLIPDSGAQIPDTTCDNGSCSESTAAGWSNTLTYGFGYRCDNITGTDCATGFSNSSYYKQFANESFNEDPQSVMAGTNVGRTKEVQITYKVNVSGTQQGGAYSNVITYIATPTF